MSFEEFLSQVFSRLSHERIDDWTVAEDSKFTIICVRELSEEAGR